MIKMGKLPAHSSNYTKGRKSPIKYIVIHYTANDGDSARGNCNYFAGAGRNASAHYFVDSVEVWQSVEDKDTAWHCGGIKYYHSKCRNDNSIGVELCSHRDSRGSYYFDDAAVANAAELVKSLMKKYDIPASNVIRHYDVTHKICPAPFVYNITAWNNFKRKLQDVYNDPAQTRSEGSFMNEGKKITTYDEAMKVLVGKGVVTTREYWDNAVKCVNYLEQLMINIANRL